MIHWQYGLLVSELVIIPSIQVGTVGLNLTAATHVIHFDRQYTPPRKTRQGPWVKTYEYQWMLMRIVRANHG
jgi:hypothetical protein